LSGILLRRARRTGTHQAISIRGCQIGRIDGHTKGDRGVNLEQALEKVVEHAHEELRVVRKRAEEKTGARDHGKDYHEAQTAADRLDHYAHLVRRLHDAEYKDGWRRESLNERAS
jgi:hypothetical protein